MSEEPTTLGPKPGEPAGRASGLVGRRIGVYDIVEEVGKGGMGVVYRAHDRSLDRDVALKVLLPSLSNDPAFEKRFVREARAAAKLDHPNIVQVYTAGRFENVLFIAMQFVKGKTLSQERIDWKDALTIARQAADALGTAHKAGLVHRDIKPTNIMIDESGRVKIMDFGLMRSSLNPERITQTGVFFGTPEYASPEQCETAEVDGRADIYSLGAVLYEMLTGRTPHVAETPLALFKKIAEEDPQEVTALNPKVPRPVVALVSRMLRRKREERYASCTELIADIDRALAGRPMRTLAPPRRNRAAMAGLAAVAVVMLTGLMWLLVSAVRGVTPVETAPGDRVGLVVFDFKNGTGDQEAQWYEIALPDMLISSLSQQPWLSVPTRDQLLWKVQDMALGDRVKDEHRRRLVAEFKAHAYVSGTFYVRGGRVRATVTVYRIRDNAPAFPTLKLDRPETEVFALIDDMSKSIADGLRGMSGRQVTHGRPSAPKPTRDVMVARMEQKPQEESANDTLTEDRKRKELERTYFASSAPDPDAVRHWYQSRRMLEKSGCDAEELQILAEDLDQQWSAPDHAQMQRALENFQNCVRSVAEAKKSGDYRLSRECVLWVCGKCAVVARTRGECCGEARALQVKVESAKKEK